MPPKATSANNASANASTLSANGQPKRKRTRGRGGRGRGGRGKKDDSSDGSSDSSSSSEDDDSSDDNDEPVASTSKIATQPSKAKSDVAPAASANGKGKASAASDEDSDEGDSSDSGSSSSSFLTTSDEEEDMPVPRNTRGQVTQGSVTDGASTFSHSQQRGGFAEQEDASRAKRPEMTKPSDPPYIQFGADADLANNARAFGKPILWGLLPGDVPSTSSGPTVFDSDEADERSKAIIEAEKAKAEERYLKFRDDYVSKMISRFGGSLDTIRQKEADTMKESRLQVLIQSIAGGADTFTSRDGQGIWKTNEQRGEREVVLEGLEMQAEAGATTQDDEPMP